MTKKVIYACILSIALLFVATNVFATDKEETETTSLGNEISSSIDGTEERINNLVDTDVGDTRNSDRRTNDNSKDTVKDDAKDIGNTVRDGVKDIENGIEDVFDGDDENSRTENRAVAGTTGNYATGDAVSNNDEVAGMSGRTWMWIILAVVAIIIIAAVWYYASQKQ